MRNPSSSEPAGTDRSKDLPARLEDEIVSSADGKAAPRLPHERDESTDGAGSEPRESMRRAREDVESGKTASDRSEASEEVYGRTLRGDTPGDERDGANTPET